MALVIKILKDKWINPPKEPQESFAGRTVLVTGSTSGIGLAAAAKYASLGAIKVIITARDMAKGDKVLTELEKKVGRKGVFELWELDMNSYESVVTFAKRANGIDQLDVVVLNAGLRRQPFALSKHGWEEDLQVNVLSTTLLGILLLPKLKQSNRGTTIPVLEFVSSGLHASAQVDDDIRNSPSVLAEYNKPERFSAQRQYEHTKLLLMFAMNKLAEATPSNQVIVTSVCPGMVATNLARDVKVPGITIVLAIMRVLLARTPEQGAYMYINGTAQDEGRHGRFWSNDAVQPIAPTLKGEKNKELAARVWEEIVEALAKDVPMVKDALATIMPGGAVSNGKARA